MTNVVFVSGLYSSGTTLLFTLFRQSEGCLPLYEPLHEKLDTFVRRQPKEVYEHHFFVDGYFTEYRGFRRISELFSSEWGQRGFHLPAEAQEDGLYRYLTYLIGTGLTREPAVVLKDPRFSFRLPWLRANFPQARVVHVHRDPDAQWQSIVGRIQRHLGREDIGQASPAFSGFGVATWCDDLAPTFPELEESRFTTGHERFRALWERSKSEQERHADVTVSLADLKERFEPTCARISEAIGFELDAERLRPFVVTDADTQPAAMRLKPLRQPAWLRPALAWTALQRLVP